MWNFAKDAFHSVVSLEKEEESERKQEGEEPSTSNLPTANASHTNTL